MLMMHEGRRRRGGRRHVGGDDDQRGIVWLVPAGIVIAIVGIRNGLMLVVLLLLLPVEVVLFAMVAVGGSLGLVIRSTDDGTIVVRVVRIAVSSRLLLLLRMLMRRLLHGEMLFQVTGGERILRECVRIVAVKVPTLRARVVA